MEIMQQVIPKPETSNDLTKCGNGSLNEALSTSEKINSCTVEAIKRVLVYCFLKVGLRTKNMPAKLEKELLISHLVTYYGNHTLKEIQLAFDLAVTGQLECDANCYENFSPLYLSKIMSAYREWASRKIREIQSQRKPIPQLAAAPMPDEEIIESAYECWKTLHRFEYINLSAYDALVRTGKLTLTREEKETLYRDAKSHAHSFQLDSVKDFQSFAKKLAVHRYFTRIDLDRINNPLE